MTLPKSSILKEIKGPVIAVTIWSTFISLIHLFLRQRNMTQAAKAMTISSKPHALLVSALGLLLVFRTNSAYQRFAEGRKIWEQILSISRNMSRMASLYSNDLGEDRRKRVFRLLSAFPYLLRHHIQPQCLGDCDAIKGSPYAILLNQPASRVRGVGSNSRTVPSNNECWIDRRSCHGVYYPTWHCLNAPTLQIVHCGPAIACPARLSVYHTVTIFRLERIQFLGQIDKLSQCIGECERIHQTTVPLNYARHSLRSLTLWLATLPFCLISEFGIITGPVVGAMAWLLLGVYQIGFTIEDPFQGSSLRLSLLCDAVYRDVMYYIGHGSAVAGSCDGSGDGENARDSAYRRLEEELEEWNALDTQIISNQPSLVIRVAP
ncbi:chloride channel [Fragilaria crotonensis]|nr:chloride channel [Fragilaria crotonensis]